MTSSSAVKAAVVITQECGGEGLDIQHFAQNGHGTLVLSTDRISAISKTVHSGGDSNSVKDYVAGNCYQLAVEFWISIPHAYACLR